MVSSRDREKMNLYSDNGESDKDGNRQFLTECESSDFTLLIDGSERCFCAKQYDAEAYARIRAEADRWHIIVRSREFWDPSFGHANRDGEKAWEREISDWNIWVKDGAFGGVMMPDEDLAGNSELKAAAIEQFDGDPVFICEHDRYGSSDRDMYSENRLYLSRKDA